MEEPPEVDEPGPQWAELRAREMLDGGADASYVLMHLRSQGLSEERAEAAVNAVRYGTTLEGGAPAPAFVCASCGQPLAAMEDVCSICTPTLLSDAWGQFADAVGGQLLGAENALPLEMGCRVSAPVQQWTLELSTSEDHVDGRRVPYTEMTAEFLSLDGFWYQISPLNEPRPDDSRTGYPDMDRDFSMQASDEAQLRRFLAEPALRDLILAQPALSLAISTVDRSDVATLELEEEGLITDLERLKALHHLAGECLDQLVRIGSAAPDTPEMAEFNRAIEEDAGDPEPYYNRALALLDRGDAAKAVADLDRVIAIDPEDLEAYYNRALAFSEQGEYTHALADLDHALQLNADWAIARYERGVTLAQLDRLGEAVDDLEAARGLSDNLDLIGDINDMLRELAGD